MGKDYIKKLLTVESTCTVGEADIYIRSRFRQPAIDWNYRPLV